MKCLTIFHDPRCGLCLGFRTWLEAQPRRVAVEFLPFDSAEAAARFPGLLELGADRDVVVMVDDGHWWQGPAAWITCLWTTRDFRDWSFRLAAPALQPFVRKSVHLLSANRLTISRIFADRTDSQIAATLEAFPATVCGDSTCVR